MVNVQYAGHLAIFIPNMTILIYDVTASGVIGTIGTSGAGGTRGGISVIGTIEAGGISGASVQSGQEAQSRQ